MQPEDQNEDLKKEFIYAKVMKTGDSIGPKEYREKNPKTLTYEKAEDIRAPYFTTNDYQFTLDMNQSGTRLVFSGTLIQVVTLNLEDCKIVDKHTEETMIFALKFDQSDNIWYVCNDMEYKCYNYMTKKVTFTYKDEKGTYDTVKEYNNMIEIDDTRGHVYCRVTNSKICEFTCASCT